MALDTLVGGSDDRENILSNVKKVLIEQIGIEGDGLQESTELNSLNIDSLDKSNLGMYLEDDYKINFPEDDSLKTIGDIVDYIERNYKK